MTSLKRTGKETNPCLQSFFKVKEIKHNEEYKTLEYMAWVSEEHRKFCQQKSGGKSIIFEKYIKIKYLEEIKMKDAEKTCQNCESSCGTEKLYCSKLTKEVEPEECCFQFSEKQQYSEAMEKLRRQFVTR